MALPVTYFQRLTDFQKSFAGRLSGKFATNSYLNIPLHLKYVAILPCENGGSLEICIVINDNSHGSRVNHLSCDGLLYYEFITQFAGERIFNIDHKLAKLQAK